jgi:hypothetical protein
MKKAIIVIVLMLVVIGGGIALFVYSEKHPEIGDPWGNKSTRELALTCLPQEYTVQHIHPQLAIGINEQQLVIPVGIGIEGASNDTSHESASKTASCLHPIHTHSADGIIHVESPEPRDYTLGDFFAVWRQPFSKDRILDYTIDTTHRIRMTVNGQESDQFENLILKDKDQIGIYYETK